MPDLREALLKAGLVDQTKVEQAEAEERAREKAARKGGPGRHEPARPPSVPAVAGPDDDAAAALLVERGKVALPARGPRRWYFLARHGKVRYAEVHDGFAGRLEAGELALVEAPDGALHAVEGATARELRVVAPGWLRFWNGQ